MVEPVLLPDSGNRRNHNQARLENHLDRVEPGGLAREGSDDDTRSPGPGG